MAVEQTLAMIKPDGVEMGVEDAILQRYVDAGLTIVKKRRHQFTREEAQEFYAEHEGRFYFIGVYLMLSCGESYVVLLEGEDAIKRVRALNGATDPMKAEPGTIRHDFRSAGGVFNTVHGSDSPAAVARERKIAFGEHELNSFEAKKAEVWKARHAKTCSRIPNGLTTSTRWLYRFTNTGVGSRIDVECRVCQKKRDITDYDSW